MTLQHCMLLWMTGSLSQFTLHFWEAKTINILRKITCEPMQPPYYIKAIPLICKGVEVVAICHPIFALQKHVTVKETSYIPIPCTKKTIQPLFKHLIYFLVTSCQWRSALVIRTFFPFWAKIILLTADFKCILCNSINWFSLEKDFQLLKLSFLLMY